MSATSTGFLRRLFLRPALWVAVLPGIAVVLLENGCWGSQPVLGSAVCLTLIGHSPSNSFFWGMIATLYIGLRVSDIKRMWDVTHRIAWFSEAALLVIGGYLIWFAVVSLFFLTFKASL